jgi:hypothetical protein
MHCVSEPDHHAQIQSWMLLQKHVETSRMSVRLLHETHVIVSVFYKVQLNKADIVNSSCALYCSVSGGILGDGGFLTPTLAPAEVGSIVKDKSYLVTGFACSIGETKLDRD